MSGLARFLSAEGLPTSESDIVETLKSPRIRQIRHFVLGPGTVSNIPQACNRWIQRTGLTAKSMLVPGRVPDEYMAAAQDVREAGGGPVYWTCAVFGREKDLFFGNGTDTLMFYLVERMRLDGMQLAARRENGTGFVTAALQTTLHLPQIGRAH